MKQLFFSVIVTLVFLTRFYAQAVAQAKLPHKVKIGVANVESPNMLPLSIARAKGFFAAEGIEVEIIRVRSDVMVAALLSGNLDYATSSTSIIPAAAKGAPLKIIAGIANGFVSFLVAQSQYRTVPGLKGRTIALGSLRGASFNHLKKILAHHGLDIEKEVKVIAMGSTPARFQTLLAGGVDSAFLTMPYNIRAVDQGLIELGSTVDAQPKTPSWGIAAGDEKLKTEKEQVRSLLRSLRRAMAFIKSNRRETIEDMTAFNLTTKEAERAYEIMSKVYAFDLKIDSEGVVELLREIQIDPATVSLKQVVDLSLLEEVVKRSR